MIDLHTHSTASDGTTTPAENAALAAAAGVAGLALTDHDTMAGWDEAARACADRSLRFVPGIELSTELGERGVHLLGYWIDPQHPGLAAECDRLRNERDRRALAILARLAQLGVHVTIDAVLSRAAGAPIGRPHLAAAMVDAGAVPDADAAFEQYLADGAPAYVPKRALAPERGVELIVAAGGAAVLAHPGLGSREADVDLGLLDRLTAAGLDGIEVDHPGHESGVRDFWRAAAAQRGLLVTGSSDFHGLRKDSRIGEAGTPTATVDTLRARAAARAAARGMVGIPGGSASSTATEAPQEVSQW